MSRVGDDRPTATGHVTEMNAQDFLVIVSISAVAVRRGGNSIKGEPNEVPAFHLHRRGDRGGERDG